MPCDPHRMEKDARSYRTGPRPLSQKQALNLAELQWHRLRDACVSPEGPLLSGKTDTQPRTTSQTPRAPATAGITQLCNVSTSRPGQSFSMLPGLSRKQLSGCRGCMSLWAAEADTGLSALRRGFRPRTGGTRHRQSWPGSSSTGTATSPTPVLLTARQWLHRQGHEAYQAGGRAVHSTAEGKAFPEAAELTCTSHWQRWTHGPASHREGHFSAAPLCTGQSWSSVGREHGAGAGTFAPQELCTL
ncbi:uncharacterized protein [Symphalangus syndactylus]|uniref:uncharacterized protein n=1 Tax=Symphalangus syndactylus TaxID=9590 RepID=UPI0024418096|nr:uncharacterized protein LOC129492717 [Symphalangus syndactylus]